MIIGDKTRIALEMTKNTNGRYSIKLIIGNRSFGNPKVFGDLHELNLTLIRFTDNKSEFENPIVSRMSSEDFFKWMLGANLTKTDPHEKYLEVKKRHKHSLQFGKSLMNLDIFCHLDDDILHINFYDVKKKNIIETSVEYKYVLAMAEEFNNWKLSLTDNERKIFEWTR